MSNFRELKKTLKRPEGPIQHFNAEVERAMEEMEAEDKEFAELEREFEEESRMPRARIGIQHFNAAEESRTPRARIGSIHHFNEAVERSMEEMEAEDKECEELQREFEEEFRMERARMGTAPEVVDAAAWHGNGAPRAAGGGLRRPRDTHPEAYWHQRR
ncbi:unnamed protein product [Linum tenue]|uniref:Uncharacterized protein n=1 Tax=Linum tenue TaxID=586396 RepID=A0AAV0HY46_9ROSI|nr:unnamed protein product [Linum tenue]